MIDNLSLRKSLLKPTAASFLLLLLLCLPQVATAQVIWFVDDDGDPDGSCTSWADACPELQTALALSKPGDQIWVAEGVYKPDFDVLTGRHTGDSEASFQLRSGVALYGGFAGAEATLEERAVPFAPTILSGDLDGNDVGSQFPDGLSFAENAHHVVTADKQNTTTILDGLTIAGGHAPSSGGGLSANSASAVVSNCRFFHNSAGHFGGAIFASGCNLVIERCEFEANASDLQGGAVMTDPSSSGSLAVTRSHFLGNQAYFGGAISSATSYPDTATLVGCVFSGNVAQGQGGAIRSFDHSLTTTNCTVAGNVTNSAEGGALGTAATLTAVTNCIFWGNSNPLGTPEGAQITPVFESLSLISFSTIQNLRSFSSGLANLSTDPHFSDPDGLDDQPGTADDDFRLLADSSSIDSAYNNADTDVNQGGLQPIPLLDIDGNPRFADSPDSSDCPLPGVFCGTSPIVDRGAHEFQPGPSLILFVDAAASGNNDGSSWQDAFVDLQPALLTAANLPSERIEIWVAQGVYKPDMGSNDRNKSFELVANVALYGGFAGGETRVEARDFRKHSTIFSGDIGVPGDSSDNSTHVVTASALPPTARLDGFVIRAGNADLWEGGGLHISQASPLVLNCDFVENNAVGGGGIAISFGFSLIANCRFFSNTASNGGGGMLVVAASPRMVNCIFSGNRACCFPTSSGGGIWSEASALELTNCTFSGNEAAIGGGVHTTAASTVRNCIFWGNTTGGVADEAAQLVVDGGGTQDVTFSLIQGLKSFDGKGNIGEDPRFVDPDGLDAIVGSADDNLRLGRGSPAIDHGNDLAVPPDIGDLDEDGMKEERTPIDLDRSPRFADDPHSPNEGLADPPVYVEHVDLGAFEFIADCNGDGAPDHDQVPQSGEVISRWFVEAGLWDDPLSWCLPEVPDNNASASFDVLVDSMAAQVTLDKSVTIGGDGFESAGIGEFDLRVVSGAALEVNDDSGAAARSLVVLGTIDNKGTLRATDRKRLLVAAPIIDQGGVCGLGGVLEATDGLPAAAGPSVLEINGSRVLGGSARTLGEHSEIHLIGGAELINVCVSGEVIANPPSSVVIPDGQSGAWDQVLTNDALLTIRGEQADTRFEPASDSAVLAGEGCVRLTSKAHARMGDFKVRFTNESGHRIEGAGIVFGGIINRGIVAANVDVSDRPGEELILFLLEPRGQPNENEEVLQAIDGGKLRIEGPLAQTSGGRIESRNGGVVEINAVIAGIGGLIANGGSVLINNTNVHFGECIEVPPPTSPEYSSGIEINNSTLTATQPGSSNDLDVSGGTVIVQGDSSATFAGPVRVCAAPDAQAEVGIVIDETSSFGAGCLKLCPGGQIANSGTVVVSGSLTFTNTDESEWQWPERSRLVLTGGMGANQGDWHAWAWLEVGGEDKGRGAFKNNFDLATLELAQGARAVLIDHRDNGNRNGSGGSAEALYVDDLELAAGAVLNLNGLHLYVAGQLVGCAGGQCPYEGGVIIDQAGPQAGVPTGCQASADLNGDRAINAYDLALLLVSWGACPGCPSDLTLDDAVDSEDLAVLLLAWSS